MVGRAGPLVGGGVCVRLVLDSYAAQVLGKLAPSHCCSDNAMHTCNVALFARNAAMSSAEKPSNEKEPRIGLALSGGGIRSATFCLGLLRGLATNQLLRRIKYMSTVSGGGYIGATLGLLAQKHGIEEAERILAQPDSMLLRWLRRHGRYVAPSGARDYGMAFATYVRSLIAIHVDIGALAMLLAITVVFPHALVENFPFEDMPRYITFWGSIWWPLALAWLSSATVILVLAYFLAAGSWLSVAERGKWCWRATVLLRWSNKVGLVMLAVGVLDWCSWNLMLSVSHQGVSAFFGALMSSLIALTLGLVRFYSERVAQVAQRQDGVFPWMALVNLVGILLLFVVLVCWVALVQWLVFAPTLSELLQFNCPASVLNFNCPVWWIEKTDLERLAWVALPICLWMILSYFNVGAANASSLQSMYRARLARAYLGAANSERVEKPGLVLGGPIGTERFGKLVDDPVSDDDRVLEEYFRGILNNDKKCGPAHLINICINHTRETGRERVNIDRKGLPLTLSSDDRDWNGNNEVFERLKEKTLASWIAISGAAASPGAGSLTSPGWAALLFFAGVRLGYWFDAGVDYFPKGAKQKPTRFVGRINLLLQEMLAEFYGEKQRHWYLSDGGHFENTGVYPLLKRRVEIIVVADCGADPRYAMADLDNLIRKARIDFGVEIEFCSSVQAREMLALEVPEKWKTLCVLSPEELANNMTARGVMMARVTYPSTGNMPTGYGLLVVVKPNLHKALDLDVRAYASENPDFPQQSTADQFFDEAQWESYQRLGYDFGKEISGKWLLSAYRAVAHHGVIRRPHHAAVGKAGPEGITISRTVAAVGALSLGGLLAGGLPVLSYMQQWQDESDRRSKRIDKALNLLESCFGSIGGEQSNAPKGFDEISYSNQMGYLRKMSSSMNGSQLSRFRDLKSKADSQGGPEHPCGKIRIIYDVSIYWREHGKHPRGTVYTVWPKDFALQSVEIFSSEQTGGDSLSAGNSSIGDDSPNKDDELSVPASSSLKSGFDLQFDNQVLCNQCVPGLPLVLGSSQAPKCCLIPFAPPIVNTHVSSVGEDLDDEKSDLRNCGDAILYTQVYDEQGRQKISGTLDELSNGDRVGVMPIENVTRTAMSAGRPPPFKHKLCTLIYHKESEQACAADLAEKFNHICAGRVITLPLPDRFRGREGVIELWFPPQN